MSGVIYFPVFLQKGLLCSNMVLAAASALVGGFCGPQSQGREAGRQQRVFSACMFWGEGNEAGGGCSWQATGLGTNGEWQRTGFSVSCHLREPATSQASSWAGELLRAGRELGGTTAMALRPQKVAGWATEQLACLRACPVSALDLALLSATWVLARAGAAVFETLPKVSARRRSWIPSVLWEAHDVPVLCLP